MDDVVDSGKETTLFDVPLRNELWLLIHRSNLCPEDPATPSLTPSSPKTQALLKEPVPLSVHSG